MTTLVASASACGPRRMVSVVTALLVAGAVRAEAAAPPASDPATYPLSARIRLSPEALAKRYEHDARFPGAPSNAAVSVEVGVQAREAYAAAASRTFGSGPGLEAVEIEVAIAAAELEGRAGWWSARVEHVVVLRAADGAEIARWPVVGEARLPGLDAQDVPRAFARAAAAAAERFERELDASGPLRRFLAERALAPRARVVAPAPVAPVSRDRGRLVGFLDLGTGVAVGRSEGIGLAARGGVSARWFLAQLTLDAWRGSFEASPAFATTAQAAALDAVSAGVDALAVLRLSQRSEVRGGVGAQRCWGRAKQRYVIEVGWPSLHAVDSDIAVAASGTVASWVAAVTYVPDTRWIPRLTVEARRALGRPLDFGVLRTEVAPAERSVAILFGLERSIR